jgi:hypothetical protein
VGELPKDLRQKYLDAIPTILSANSISINIHIEGKTSVVSHSSSKKGESRKGS